MSKPLKLFISYSHMDEELLKQFVPHLAVLKRTNVLETWFDRELIAGDQFDKEIEKNLVAADLVAFLVSADFLHSWYCYEKELKTALAKAEHSQVRIIPIIVRPCDWQDTDLGGYLAATRDGKPITTSGNRDEAWLEVVRSIRRAAETLLNREDVSSGDSVCPDSIEPELAEKFDQILDSTEIQFSSRFKANIDLQDIFVPPDLKNLKREYDDIENTVPAFNIVNNVEKFPRVVILGAEQYGKTSLAKTYFRKSLGTGALALLCDAKSIKSSDFSVVQKKLVLSQYVTPSPADFTRSQAKKVLIVDDYDALGLNLRFQKSLLETFSTIFDQVILIAGTSLRFDEDRLVDLSGFSQYEILPFGNVKRGELIDRWNSLGREQTVDLRDLHNDNDRLTADVDAIIRKNILPKAPIYILTIIQLLETSSPSDYTLDAHYETPTLLTSQHSMRHPLR
jgi:hypothetical protein